MDAGKKVLAVDDETSITEIISALLSPHGYEVTVANNGHDALRKFEASSPDIVITDIVMPDMEGIELIRSIRKKASESDKPVPILIAISGNNVGIRFLRAAELVGAGAILKKPFSGDDLLYAIDRASAKTRSHPGESSSAGQIAESGETP